LFFVGFFAHRLSVSSAIKSIHVNLGVMMTLGAKLFIIAICVAAVVAAYGLYLAVVGGI